MIGGNGMITNATLPPRAGCVEVDGPSGRRVYRDIRTGLIIDPTAPAAPTAEDRISALEEAMLAMIGVTPDV